MVAICPIIVSKSAPISKSSIVLNSGDMAYIPIVDIKYPTCLEWPVVYEMWAHENTIEHS